MMMMLVPMRIRSGSWRMNELGWIRWNLNPFQGPSPCPRKIALYWSPVTLTPPDLHTLKLPELAPPCQVN